jgi:hypothetical protein
MDEYEVESLRRDIGEKMARDNTDPLSADASDSLKQGFRRGALGFGSNVTPRHFGRGNAPPDWTCLCGNVNPGRTRKKIAGRIVCWQCELDQDTVLLANHIDKVKDEPAVTE